MSEHVDLPNVAAAAADVKAYDAVAVLGAGVSLSARLPLSGGLDALLWRALEGDPEALAQLQADTSLGALPAKEILQRLGPDHRVAWKAVSAYANARERFQRTFAALDSQRHGQFLTAHSALAEMLHRRELEFIVSLNWDTQLEQAWLARYGQPQTIGERLFKPHGDALRPEEPWVLPGDERGLPAELVRRVGGLLEDPRPRVLLIVGYSETDEQIVQQVIAPLEEHWKVVRVGPTAPDGLAIRATAEVVLPRLRTAIDPGVEAPAWTYLHFEPQHDFATALSGRRLGTQDVRACPVMPEVRTALVELRTTGSVTIVGESGTGKSLAAAHVAHGLWSEGAEVAALADPTTQRAELRQSLLGLPRPLVAILDDAQRLPPATRRELLGCGGDGLYVIAVLNALEPEEAGVRLDVGRATATLAAFIRVNGAELLPAVHALDPHVGDGPGDEPLERRLAQAETVATTPWQLTYVLTGGWRRIRGHVSELRTNSEYDLILGLVAIVQRLRLDGSATEQELRELAEATGHDGAWLQAATEHAARRRLLIREHEAIRLPHLRFTRVVLEVTLRSATSKPLLEAVRVAIDRERYELMGIHWLLDELFFADPRASPKRSQLALDTADRLVARCWDASRGERGAAALVLNDLRRVHPEAVELMPNAEVFGSWISGAQTLEMPGLARLLNDTYNEEPERLTPICSHVDTAALVRAFEASSWPDPYFFGKLFDRLGLGPPEFVERMAAELDRDAVAALFRRWPLAKNAELFDVVEALRGVASFDYGFALDLCEELAPSMAERWEPRFASGYSELLDVLFLLGFGPPFLRRRQPEARQRRIARRLCESLDPASVASQVSRSSRREWQGIGEGLHLVAEASPRHVKRILRLVEFDLLDASTAAFWPERVEALGYLLVGLARDPDNEPVASWVARHAPEMTRVEVLAAALAPAACAKRLDELQAVIDLSRPSAHWSITGLALCGVAVTAPDIVRRSFVAHRQAFSDAFGEAFELEDAGPVLTVLNELDEEAVRGAVGAIDPALARGRWVQVLRKGPAPARQVVARLVAIALETGGPMSVLARDLQRQFPSAARVVTRP